MSTEMKVVWYGRCREGQKEEVRRLESQSDKDAMCADWGLKQSSELIMYPVVELTHWVEKERYIACTTQITIPDSPPW